MRTLVVATLIVLSGLLWNQGAATGATVRVPDDAPTIGAGVAAAAAGDTVLVAPGLYSGPANRDIDIDRDLVVRSEGGAPVTVIDLERSGRAFRLVLNSSSTVVDGFTFQRGRRCPSRPVDGYGGAIDLVISSAIVRDCVFADNGACYGGGAIRASEGEPLITRCTFSGNGHGNPGTALGGAILATSGTISDCRFTDNTAVNGGAIVCDPEVTILGCAFTGNTAVSGGAIEMAQTVSGPTIRGCTFEGNRATVAGGGAIKCYNATATIEDCLFARNVAHPRGGAVDREVGWGESLRVTRSTFLGNSATASGGAICVAADAPLEVRSSTFHGNSAPSGSGIQVDYGTVIPLENTIIASGLLGEAMACPVGVPRVACCDIFDNAGGDWAACLSGQLGANGNISVDPRFCDPGGGDLRLAADSPCAPDHAPPGCGLIGARPVGCGVTAVEAVTWGRVKGGFGTR